MEILRRLEGENLSKAFKNPAYSVTKEIIVVFIKKQTDKVILIMIIMMMIYYTPVLA